MAVVLLVAAEACPYNTAVVQSGIFSGGNALTANVKPGITVLAEYCFMVIIYRGFKRTT